MAGRLAPVARAVVCAVLALAGTSLSVSTSTSAEPAIERVRGFFCNAKDDQVAFLLMQAKGENEEIAANAVNKSIAKFSCAYYIPADAIFTGERTVVEGGLVFKLQSYLFLPEKVERWSGSVFGSLQPSTAAKADI